MSDFINENPNVLDDSQLPKRAVDDAASDLYDDYDSSSLSTFKNLCTKDTNRRLANILQDTDYEELESSVLKDVKDLNQLLTLQDGIDHNKFSSFEEPTDTEKKKNYEREPIDAQEIYDLIAHISDPEHPMSLGQLSIVKLDDIEINTLLESDHTQMKSLIIRITPTITHCSLATLIGLGIRVRLDRALHPKYRPTIILKQGTHQSENQVNKQLNDKERVAAACENDQLLNVIRKMLSTCK